MQSTRGKKRQLAKQALARDSQGVREAKLVIPERCRWVAFTSVFHFEPGCEFGVSGLPHCTRFRQLELFHPDKMVPPRCVVCLPGA